MKTCTRDGLLREAVKRYFRPINMHKYTKGTIGDRVMFDWRIRGEFIDLGLMRIDMSEGYLKKGTTYLEVLDVRESVH